MCGLVGIISRQMGGLYGGDLDVFEEALIIDTLRGKDSTGAFTAFKDTSAKAIKHGGVPHLLFRDRRWSEFRGDAVSRGRFVIGHNRAATRGEVNTDNSHPFVEENIILAHNGTLSHGNDKELTDNSVTVDSNAIAHALASGTPEEVLPKIRGAYALIWYNTDTGKLHAIRNDQRPLWLMVTKDHYMLASEAWMLGMPYRRKNGRSEITNTTEIEPGDLYTWDLDGKLSVKTLDMTPPKEQRSTTGGPPTTGTGNSTTAESTTTTTASNEQVFPEESANKAGRTTPEAGVLRQAMESVSTAVKQQEKPHGNVCALTQNVAGDAKKDCLPRTSTPTTESDSTKTSTVLNLSASRTNDSQRNGGTTLTEVGISTTRGQKQTSSLVNGAVGLTASPMPTTEDMEIRATMKNLVATPLYPQGRVVLVRVNSKLHNYKSKERFLGCLKEPGMEMVDVQGLLPDNVKVGDHCTGVIYFTDISVHGPTVWVTNVQPCEQTSIHGKHMVPKHLWSIAYRECTCDKCDGHILLHDKGFTSVALKSLLNKTQSGLPLNVIEVLCADCVEKNLPPGEYLESFKARRRNFREAIENAKARAKNAAAHPPVPEGITGSVEPSRQSGPLILLPGTPTVH